MTPDQTGEVIGIVLLGLPCMVMSVGLHQIARRTGHGFFWKYCAYLPVPVVLGSVVHYLNNPLTGDLVLGLGVVGTLFFYALLALVIGLKRWPQDRVSMEVFR